MTLPEDIKAERLALIAMATPNLLLLLDGDGLIEWVNPSCKAPELLDAVLHKIHAASARGMYPARTLAGVA